MMRHWSHFLSPWASTLLAARSGCGVSARAGEGGTDGMQMGYLFVQFGQNAMYI